MVKHHVLLKVGYPVGQADLSHHVQQATCTQSSVSPSLLVSLLVPDFAVTQRGKNSSEVHNNDLSCDCGGDLICSGC